MTAFAVTAVGVLVVLGIGCCVVWLIRALR